MPGLVTMTHFYGHDRIWKKGEFYFSDPKSGIGNENLIALVVVCCFFCIDYTLSFKTKNYLNIWGVSNLKMH